MLTDYSVSYNLINVTFQHYSGFTLLLSINNWLILLNRFNGSVNFTRNWAEYREGFGDPPPGDYWLGLEKMHQLTSGDAYRLRIEMETLDNETWFSAEYASFSVDSESLDYAVHLSGFSGDAGDAFASTKPGCALDGMKFSTFDRDNDLWMSGSCVMTGNGGGGFWYQRCMYVCLTNAFGSKVYYWGNLTDLGLSPTPRLRTSRMMIKMI